MTMSNKKENIIHIKVYPIFGKSISTRKAAVSLFQQVKNQKAVLDFTRVKFVSRSFMHELLRLKNESNIEIKLENLSEDLKAMMGIVQKASEDKHIESYPSHEVDLSYQSPQF